MNIVYYTSGITGAGRIVRGFSIGNALNRKRVSCNYTLLSYSSSLNTHDYSDYKHIELPEEHENILLGDKCRDSILYNTLTDLNPDIIIFDMVWYTTYEFIQDFKCKKIFLSRQISDQFFMINMPDRRLVFNPDHFDLIFATEPFQSSIDMRSLNPIVIRNRDEILSRDVAIKKLEIKTDKPICLFAYNGKPGEFEIIKNEFSYLENEGYSMVYSTNYSNHGLFPIADYFNAFDFIISGAGYNAFWEIIFFNKEGVFVPVKRRFEDQYWRVQNCQEYYFEDNGADQLVDIIVNM